MIRDVLEGGGGGVWRGEVGRGSRKSPPPPVVSGLKGQRKISSSNAEEICDRRPKRTLLQRIALKIPGLDRASEEEGERGVGGWGEGGSSSDGCQAFQYIPARDDMAVHSC